VLSGPSTEECIGVGFDSFQFKFLNDVAFDFILSKKIYLLLRRGSLTTRRHYDSTIDSYSGIKMRQIFSTCPFLPMICDN
jgi:hypothetical protein